MKNILKTIIITLLLALLFAGCKEKIDLTLDESTVRLVVEGNFTTDTTEHVVILSTTTSYYNNEAPPMISNAHVSITDGANTYVLHEKAPGIYKTDAYVFGVPNVTYTLDIELEKEIGGFKTYSAQSTLSKPIPIDTTTLNYVLPTYGKASWFLTASWKRRPETDYYRFLTYRNGKLLSKTFNEWFTIDDVFETQDSIAQIVDVLNLSEDGNRLYSGDTITIEMDMITKDFLKFIQDAQKESFGSNPLFSGPPANVKGNISNGAIGYFAAYSYSRYSSIVPAFRKK